MKTLVVSEDTMMPMRTWSKQLSVGLSKMSGVRSLMGEDTVKSIRWWTEQMLIEHLE